MGNFVETQALRAEAPWGRAALLDLVLDELSYGVAVATPEGELLHANQAARYELARGRVLVQQQGRLRTRLAQDAQALRDALERAAGGKRSLLQMETEDGGRVGLAVVPVRRHRPTDPVQAALLFSRAAVCESLMLCFFARSHSLTPTEEHVLGILSQGYSAPEVAQHLHVAVSTVRSHVRSLCAKTRSSGVRELVNRLAMLPPVAPAVRSEPTH